MTKQEIKDLIAAKIAGQGSAVDVGGALPVILNEILDAIPETPTVLPAYLEMKVVDMFQNLTASQAAETFGINMDQFEALIRGKYPVAVDTINLRSYLVVMENDGDTVYFIVGDSSSVGANYRLYYHNNAWSFEEI